MALHFDGFDQFLDINNGPTPGLIMAGYGVQGTPVGLVGRFSRGLGINGADSVTRSHPWSGNLFSVGLAISYKDRGPLLWVKTPTDRVALWMDEETGNPHLNATRGESIPVPNRFYYYELEFNRAAGTVRLFVNGRPDAHAPIPGSMGSASILTVGVGFVGIDQSPYWPIPTIMNSLTIDDLYINEGSHFGPVVVSTRMPRGDATPSDWEKASDSVDESHAWMVNNTPPMLNEKYIVSDTHGDTDLFTSHDKLVSGKRIIATGLFMVVRRSPSFSGSIRGIIGDDSNAAKRTGVVSVPTDWKGRYLTFGERGSDTKSGIEAATFGVQVV